MLTIIGSTTVSAKTVATAASMAFPPMASISRPAAAARGWLAATIPRAATASCFSVVKRLPALSRHALLMPFSFLHEIGARGRSLLIKVTIYYACDAMLEPLDSYNREEKNETLSHTQTILIPLWWRNLPLLCRAYNLHKRMESKFFLIYMVMVALWRGVAYTSASL